VRFDLSHSLLGHTGLTQDTHREITHMTLTETHRKWPWNHTPMPHTQITLREDSLTMHSHSQWNHHERALKGLTVKSSWESTPRTHSEIIMREHSKDSQWNHHETIVRGLLGHTWRTLLGLTHDALTLTCLTERAVLVHTLTVKFYDSQWTHTHDSHWNSYELTMKPHS